MPTAPAQAFLQESDSNGRLRVSDWMVQGLYDYAVKETVELRLLAVFQHVADPTRVCIVADKNSTVAPLDLRPTFANQVFKSNSFPAPAAWAPETGFGGPQPGSRAYFTRCEGSGSFATFGPVAIGW